MEFLLYFGGPFLGAFLVQFFIGCRTAYRALRYIPLYCFGIVLIFAVIALGGDSGFFVGLNVLAAAIWALVGVFILLGYGAAILAYKMMGGM